MNTDKIKGAVISLAVVGLMTTGGVIEAHLQYGIKAGATTTDSTVLANSTATTTAGKG